jgi:predicted DNA-binding transcriptional regulator YafY
MKRTERLFALAEHLRGRRTGVTADQLAERFEVSVRTIYRDLDSLREASLPLHADRGRGGGYALDRSYSLPPVNFTAREAALLLTAGDWMVRHRLLPFTDTLKLALDKVRAALPVRSQRDVERLLGTLQTVGVPVMPVERDVRRAVEQAWFENRPMRIVYDGSKGRTQRRVLLRAVVMDRKETLLNCTDLDKGEPRQFRMHRVVRAEVIDQEK